MCISAPTGTTRGARWSASRARGVWRGIRRWKGFPQWWKLIGELGPDKVRAVLPILRELRGKLEQD